jgi:hypothetical protein
MLQDGSGGMQESSGSSYTDHLPKGTTFTMQPPGSEAFLSTLLEVRKDEAFVDETVIDDTRVVVHHGITALGDGGSRILYRTETTGPVAEEIGPFVTEDFGSVLAALKKIAEA